MSDFLPVSRPHFFGQEMNYIEQALRSTRISGAGAYVDRMEAMVAAAAGSRHAIAVSSGTSALDLVFTALGVEPGGVCGVAISVNDDDPPSPRRDLLLDQRGIDIPRLVGVDGDDRRAAAQVLVAGPMGEAIGELVELAIVQGCALKADRGPVLELIHRLFEVIASEVGRISGDGTDARKRPPQPPDKAQFPSNPGF